MTVIGYIRNDYKEKFGIPRQSGLNISAVSFVELVPPFNQAEAFRGLSGFSHIWLLWDFSQAGRGGFTATVKPPKLGGNARMGVFATRSPYRPNHIGLSSVKLDEIVTDEMSGCVNGLLVSGADLLDGTPIYDIKPYLPYTDSHPDAEGGWTDTLDIQRLEVVFPEELMSRIPKDKRAALLDALAEDPRPGYHDEPDRRYGMLYSDFDVRFTISDGTLTVFEVEKTVKNNNS